MRLIDADALKEDFKKMESYHSLKLPYDVVIDNAPTVEPEKVLVANVTFDVDKLKEIVQTEVIDKIKSGELVISSEERPQGECRTCIHRDPEDRKCDCGELERVGCPFPVSDDYFCKFYEKGGAEE